MMNLFYAPGACSQAPHIVLHETGLDHDSTRVDLRAKRTEHGDDYLAINPKGSVPALQLESGDVLTENAVILQYVADVAGASDLLPPIGDFRRYRVLEWVNYITTELHKTFAPLFNPKAGDEVKAYGMEMAGQKFDYVDGRLGDGPYLMGETFTIADAYLFVITGWAGAVGLDLGRWPNLEAYRQRLMGRPSVRRVLEFEGLLKEEVAG
jgi:glutathione S-transferase